VRIQIEKCVWVGTKLPYSQNDLKLRHCASLLVALERIIWE